MRPLNAASDASEQELNGCNPFQPSGPACSVPSQHCAELARQSPGTLFRALTCTEPTNGKRQLSLRILPIAQNH